MRNRLASGQQGVATQRECVSCLDSLENCVGMTGSPGFYEPNRLAEIAAELRTCLLALEDGAEASRIIDLGSVRNIEEFVGRVDLRIGPDQVHLSARIIPCYEWTEFNPVCLAWATNFTYPVVSASTLARVPTKWLSTSGVSIRAFPHQPLWLIGGLHRKLSVPIKAGSLLNPVISQA